MFKRFAHLISLQLESEAERARATAALLDERATSELREQFIAILGHDLCNPLQALIAGGELLTRKAADPLTVNLVSRMKTNAARMSSLISGMGPQVAEVADAGTALQLVARELQDIRPERTLVSDIAIDGAIRCDLGRIQQVVSNLLSNALTDGHATTPVRFEASATADQLVLEVWNDGEPSRRKASQRSFRRSGGAILQPTAMAWVWVFTFVHKSSKRIMAS